MNSNGFATPLGYQTHLMVMSPGRYRTLDFFRIGLPVSRTIIEAHGGQLTADNAPDACRFAIGVNMAELIIAPDRVIRERRDSDPRCSRMRIYDLEGELFFGSAPERLLITAKPVDAVSRKVPAERA